MNIWCSGGISEPTLHIRLSPACFSHTTVSPIINVGRFILEAIHNLLPFTSVSRVVLSFQENGMGELNQPMAMYIMSTIPWARLSHSRYQVGGRSIIVTGRIREPKKYRRSDRKTLAMRCL